MTNAALVQEINRAIRGVAANYPDGFELICQQVDALRPRPAVVLDTPHVYAMPRAWAHADVGVDGAVTWRPENQSAPSTQPSATPKEQEARDTQQVAKRGRGRPRKVRTEG